MGPFHTPPPRLWFPYDFRFVPGVLCKVDGQIDGRAATGTLFSHLNFNGRPEGLPWWPGRRGGRKRYGDGRQHCVFCFFISFSLDY